MVKLFQNQITSKKYQFDEIYLSIKRHICNKPVKIISKDNFYSHPFVPHEKTYFYFVNESVYLHEM